VGAGESEFVESVCVCGRDPVNKKDPTGLDDEEAGLGDLIECGPFGLIPQGACASFLQSSNKPMSGVESLPRESRADVAESKEVLLGLIRLRRSIDSDCLNFLKSGIAGGSTGTFNDYFNVLIGTDARTPLARSQELLGNAA
jgi:hypothetical protein